MLKCNSSLNINVFILTNNQMVIRGNTVLRFKLDSGTSTLLTNIIPVIFILDFLLQKRLKRSCFIVGLTSINCGYKIYQPIKDIDSRVLSVTISTTYEKTSIMQMTRLVVSAGKYHSLDLLIFVFDLISTSFCSV